MKRRTVLSFALLFLPRPAAATDMRFAGSHATVDIEGDHDTRLAALIERWIDQSAAAVIAYYGHFPVPKVHLHIILQDGSGVRGGQTFPGDVPLILGRRPAP